MVLKFSSTTLLLLTNVICFFFGCRSIHTFVPTLSQMSSVTLSASYSSYQFMPLIHGSACFSSATTSTTCILTLFGTATKVRIANSKQSAQPFSFVDGLGCFSSPLILVGCWEQKDKKVTKHVFHKGRPHSLRCKISRSNFRSILPCRSTHNFIPTLYRMSSVTLYSTYFFFLIFILSFMSCDLYLQTYLMFCTIYVNFHNHFSRF